MFGGLSFLSFVDDFCYGFFIQESCFLYGPVVMDILSLFSCGDRKTAFKAPEKPPEEPPKEPEEPEAKKGQICMCKERRKVITLARKLSHTLLCPTLGAMKCGCALHVGHMSARKSRNTLKKYNKPRPRRRPKGAPGGRFASVPLGVCCNFECFASLFG